MTIKEIRRLGEAAVINFAKGTVGPEVQALIEENEVSNHAICSAIVGIANETIDTVVILRRRLHALNPHVPPDLINDAISEGLNAIGMAITVAAGVGHDDEKYQESKKEVISSPDMNVPELRATLKHLNDQIKQ